MGWFYRYTKEGVKVRDTKRNATEGPLETPLGTYGVWVGWSKKNK